MERLSNKGVVCLLLPQVTSFCQAKSPNRETVFFCFCNDTLLLHHGRRVAILQIADTSIDKQLDVTNCPSVLFRDRVDGVVVLLAF